MASKLNLNGSTNGRKLGMSSISMSSMPLEWLDAGSWRLPSGKALAEFALQAGFLAPLLLKTERFPARRALSDSRRAADKVLTGGTKVLGKGTER
jgi:hypothetical protein